MQIYFHVGMPRTASTFLQYKVFPVLEGIKYIKKHNFKKHNKIISEASFDKFLLSSILLKPMEIDITTISRNISKAFAFIFISFSKHVIHYSDIYFNCF